MGEVFLALFIFVGVIAITALIFGGWVIINVARGIGALFGIHPRRAIATAPGPRSMTQAGGSTVQCRVPGCRHPNPAGARFCRHCGHAFPQMQAVAARRVAML